MAFIFFIMLGVAIYIFGFFMGLVCASHRRRNEPCATMCNTAGEDPIDAKMQ